MGKSLLEIAPGKVLATQGKTMPIPFLCCVHTLKTSTSISCCLAYHKYFSCYRDVGALSSGRQLSVASKSNIEEVPGQGDECLTCTSWHVSLVLLLGILMFPSDIEMTAMCACLRIREQIKARLKKRKADCTHCTRFPGVKKIIWVPLNVCLAEFCLSFWYTDGRSLWCLQNQLQESPLSFRMLCILNTICLYRILCVYYSLITLSSQAAWTSTALWNFW